MIELLSSSSSESDSESDSDLNLLLSVENVNESEFIFKKILKDNNNKRKCVRNYFEETLMSYSEEKFIQHFRISRELFERLKFQFESSESFKNLGPNRYSASKQLATFLYFAGHEVCSFRHLANRFDLSLSTVSLIIERITMFFSNMAKSVIKWPNENQKKRTSTYFFNKTGFPNIIGAVDGSHIIISPPNNRKDDYINRKGNFSLNLQGMCNENRKFISIFVGFPGSCHDNWVLQNSFIYPKLQNLCGEYYLLGDSAYPCKPFLLTPYKDNGYLTRTQKNFNKKLNTCRVRIEHTFGILKQRFQQLYYCKLKGIPKLCHFIRACCVLHNLASENDLKFFMSATPDCTQNEEYTENFSNEENSGKSLRDEICKQLYKEN